MEVKSMVSDRKSILLVEPDRDLRGAMRKTLERSGYNVVIASDGREAMGTLSNGTIDLIISALRMPNMGGIELMREINGTRADMPVIFLTGHGDVESYMDLMNMGAFDYFEKPVREEDILRIVGNAIVDSGSRWHTAYCSQSA
jgi:DNA-binding NtrC family response regulator